MGAAASAAWRTAAEGSGAEEQECRICRHPAEPGRPLRHPCACRGSIRFVHDDCQLRWLAATSQCHCEVCGHEISIRPIYGADAPALARLASLIVLPLCLVLTAKIVWTLTGLYLWRLALAGSRAEAFRLLTVCSCRPAALSQLVLSAENALRAKYGGRRGRCQVLALRLLQFSFLVASVDMVLACTLAFIPVTLGRMILLCIGEVDSFTSTPPILLIGYGFIFSLGVTFTGVLHTTGGVFQRFDRGFRALSDFVEQFWDFYVLDLYNYVVDERIVIGQRLEDIADGR
ncbi:hypothetical protein VPH35_017477 [Triticum aestivum]|uniref:E3 ubiquitin-protein ligase MARCHF6-like n=1 Tax=Triticum aestivum TaxID=4565 RepID=UPI001D0075D6|nr:E3 ubiquitin-protein ligase MARCHF6-like [Triticum aestivum]